MSVPRISVVTPSYNQVQYLRDNLDSVERQVYDNVEHIVLDGGSNDGSQAVIEDYADRVPYDVVWRSESDDGQSAAINEGFEKATGDIVGWLNSDDVYFDMTVFTRVADWFDRTGTDVIYGDLAYVDGRSRVTEIDVRPDFDRAKLAYRILIGQPATFFRSEVVKTERLDPSLQYCMDYEYWVRLSQRFDVRHVRDVLAGFRRHEAQKTEDMEPVNREVDRMLKRYAFSLPERSRTTLVENAMGEVARIVASGRESVRMSCHPPQLAFDGTVAPLPELLSNLGPGVEDLEKVLARL